MNDTARPAHVTRIDTADGTARGACSCGWTTGSTPVLLNAAERLTRDHVAGSAHDYLGRIADTGDHVPAEPGAVERTCRESFRGAIGDCVRPVGHVGPHQGAHGYAWRPALNVGDRVRRIADGAEGTVEQVRFEGYVVNLGDRSVLGSASAWTEVPQLTELERATAAGLFELPASVARAAVELVGCSFDDHQPTTSGVCPRCGMVTSLLADFMAEVDAERAEVEHTDECAEAIRDHGACVHGPAFPVRARARTAVRSLSRAVDDAVAEVNAEFLADPAAQAEAAAEGDRWAAILSARAVAGEHGVVLPTALARDLLAELSGQDTTLGRIRMVKMLTALVDDAAAPSLGEAQHASHDLARFES